jgi:alkylation response protein AidB-like acyl-CoA dehydrogenase
LCRTAIVPELNGLALPSTQALEVFETLASQEASVSWIVWNNSLPCLFSRFLPPTSRAEIFADPNWLYANSTRPSGKAAVEADGYRLNGRWSLVSGCELAEWIALMSIVEENGEIRMASAHAPDMRFLFVRRGDYEILDTWHVGGLRGSGSHDVVVQDLFVPAEYSLSPAEPPNIDHPIGRVPIICSMGIGFGAQMLGLANTALNTVIDLGKTKITPGPMPDMRDRLPAQAAVGRQMGALAAARSYLHQCTDKLWQQAVAGNPPDLNDIGNAYSANSHAVAVSRETINSMYDTAGTSALYVDSPLERIHRDLHAMLRHVVAQPVWVEQVGRVKFDMETTDDLYAL